MHYKVKEIIFPVFQWAISWMRQINLLRWKLFSGAKKEYNLKVYSDKKYKFTPYGDIPRIVFSRQFLISMNRSFEHNTFEQFTKHLKPGNTVLDIGANVGLYALYSADIVGSSGKVYAFEPSKDTFDALNKNIELNGFSNIVASQVALSNETSKVVLATPAIAKAKYEDSFKSMDLNIDVETASSDTEVIDTIPLDDFIIQNNIRKVDFIKIDVEGAEFMVLQGAKELLSSPNRPVVILEAGDDMCQRFGNTVADTICFINQFGYHIEQYEPQQWVCIPSNKK